MKKMKESPFFPLFVVKKHQKPEMLLQPHCVRGYKKNIVNLFFFLTSLKKPTTTKNWRSVYIPILQPEVRLEDWVIVMV